MTSGTAPQKLFVTLVHGTWGRGFFPRLASILPRRGSLWFEQGGAFHASLARELQEAGIPHELDALIWSGDNSIRARDAAGMQLAERIRARNRDQPQARHLIVGHSHGGNVALRAVHHLGGEVPDPLIATLATPFMLAVRREESRKERRVIAATDVLAIIIAGSLYLKASIDPPSSVDTSFDFWTETLPIVVLVGAVLLRLVVSGSSAIAVYRRTELVELTARSWSGKERMLVLRSVDDEAALSLAAGSIANRISNSFMRWLAFLQGIAVFLLVVLIPILVLMLLIGVKDTDEDGIAIVLVIGLGGMFYSTAVTVLVVMAVSARVVFILVDGLCKSVFGREMLFGSLTMDVDTNSTPDTYCDVVVRTLRAGPTEAGGMRHSLYDHPQAASTLASWITKMAMTDGKPPDRKAGDEQGLGQRMIVERG